MRQRTRRQGRALLFLGTVDVLCTAGLPLPMAVVGVVLGGVIACCGAVIVAMT